MHFYTYCTTLHVSTLPYVHAKISNNTLYVSCESNNSFLSLGVFDVTFPVYINILGKGYTQNSVGHSVYRTALAYVTHVKTLHITSRT